MAVVKKQLTPQEARAKARNTTYLVSGSKQELKEMEKLQTEIAQYNQSLSDYMAQSEDWLNKPETMDAKKDNMNEMYNRRMMMMCAMPLARGLSVDSVISCVGMYAGICLVNKDFKNSVKKSVGSMLAPHLEEFSQKIEERYPSDSTKGKVGIRKLGMQASAWRERIIRSQNDGRLPYSPQSAAVQDLALHKMAFQEMRQPGADIEKIRKQHTEARERLFELAARDGVTKDQICQQVRVMVGKISMAEERSRGLYNYEDTGKGQYNDMSSMFEETACCKGRFYRDDYYEENVLVHDDAGNPHMVDKNVWNGEYYALNEDDEPFGYEGDFTPREPRSKEDAIDRAKMAVQDAYDNSHDGKSFFNNMFAVYHMMSRDPKNAIRFANGDERIQRNMDRTYATYRDAHMDFPLEYDKFEQLSKDGWQNVVDTVLDEEHGVHPEWKADYMAAFREEMQNHGDVYAKQPQAWEGAYEATHNDDSVKREYHSPVENYDFEAEDKSVDGRGSQFEESHRDMLQTTGPNELQQQI